MKHIFLSTFFLLLSICLFAQLNGKVVSIADGDTFTLLTADKRQVRVRLHGIDCPEKTQPWGNKAKEFTSEAIFGKTVSVQEKDIDRYGRTIGMVTMPNGEILNEALLKAGLAWHYTYYDINPEWAVLEQIARKQKLGLWKDSEPIAPWQYRRLGELH